MKKILSFLLLLILSLGLLVGCSSGDSESSNEENNTDTSTEQTETDFPMTVTDALDNEITLEAKPERIVSLIPSNTEVAFALGLGDKIVGVSDHDNYPEEVKKIEKIGGMELNVEKIISLKPDLVLAHGSGAHNSKEALQMLRDSDINVFVVDDAQDIESVYGSINQIGQVTGTAKKAEEIVSGMKEEFAALKEKTKTISDDERKSVFFEVAPAPEIYTAGKNTFMDALLKIINAENAAKKQEGWVKMDPEAIVQLNPDIIITTYGYYQEKPVEQVLQRDGWDDVNAIKNKQVYDIHSDLVSRAGPRLVEGAKEIAKVVYPDLFKE